MTEPLDLAALARELAEWIDSDMVPDDFRQSVAARLQTVLELVRSQSHAAGLERGRIEGALAEHEKWADWANIERDYKRMLAEFEARADGSEALAKLEKAAARAEGLIGPTS